MERVAALFKLVLAFTKNVWGSVRRPYATYRQFDREDPYQLLIHMGLIALYFFLVSPVKLRTLHPFILSLNVSRLFTVSLTTYIGICLLLLVLGKMVGGKPNLRAILLGWGYSLIPTLIWFFATSLFYLLLPPPRTETILGRSFSLIFNTFSLSLFFWKGMLYYLTLRFGMKLDLRQISVISVIFLPLLVVYAVLMYRFHIFRVPFV